MKIPKSHFSEYFKRSVVFLVKTEFAVFIVSILEFLDLCTNMIDVSYQIFYFNQTYNYKEIELSKIILSISPYQYFFNYISGGDDSGLTRNYIFIFVYAVLAIWFFTYFFSITNCNLDLMGPVEKLMQNISINFFDFFLFRVLPIYGFDIFSREIMKACAKGLGDYTYLDLIILLVALFILGGLLILHIIYYSRISVWSNFRIIESYFTHYPYDSFFSAKCDMVFCTLKCLITLNKNYLFYNHNKIDYVSEFLAILVIIAFFGYIFFILYLFFFSYQILYFFMTGFNMLRLLLILFLSESIFLRILLNKNRDYKSFFVYEIIFLLFDCYIIFGSFYDYVLSKAIKSQNYLAVCWFIQANKIDITQFITEWIANHKTVCFDKNCDICDELIKGHVTLSTAEAEDVSTVINNQTGTTNNNIYNTSNNNAINKDTMNVNLIMKIYPPYIFNLKLINISFKIKKSFSPDDLIRLDFLYLTVLFLSNRNVEYRLFSKICKLIIQYGDNINVSVSLMLIFEIIRKSNLDVIKGYDLIKKNEDLRNSLKEYITEYENFIHFGAKSPENYLYISKKFREFKMLTRSIHTLFKKNLECNYQLIIMRYSYETLLHIKFKNMTPFDLGFFSDFLEYHYNGDKLFLLKYIIDRDTFTIIKGSKEVLKYQGNSLDSLFPEYLKETGLNLFKNQLENVEKNDQKPIFSFVIKDLGHQEAYGFVDSFKMKYFVYPTNMINELLMQANFVNGFTNIMIFNGFTNIMIFEELEGEQILFAFSAQLYKYFGITPNMIYVLKKAGMNVDFDLLFPNRQKKDEKKRHHKHKSAKNINNNNMYNLDENTYLFEYKQYLPIYKKLLECDGLNDVSNFAQLKEKANELAMMAQEEKEIIFNILPKEKFENCGVKYEIFSVKEQKRKKKGYGKITTEKLGSYAESESNDDSGGTGDDDFDRKYEGKGLNISMPTLSSASISRQSSIRQTFKIFKRGIESSPLSLLSNYCYYTSNKNISDDIGNQCLNFYKEYSENITKKYPSFTLFVNHSIYQLIQEEIKYKYNDIITTFNDYQKAIYNLDSGVINKISEITAFSYSIKVEGSYVILVKTDMNFISLCREYNNYITTLLEGYAYIKELFSLVAFTETKTILELRIKSQFEGEFTQTRKIMLLMLMAYPSIHIGLSRSSTIMQEEFHSSLNKIEILLVIFFILQLIFHAILILIFILFLYVYVKMVKINILTANKLFSDKKFLELQDRRVEQLKIMSNLYQENPNKICDKIDSIEYNYRKKMGDNTAQRNRRRMDASNDLAPEEKYSDIVSVSSVNHSSREKPQTTTTTKSKPKQEPSKDSGSISDDEKKKDEKSLDGNKSKADKSDDESTPLTALAQMNNVSDKIFNRITIYYKIILFISLSIYMAYCVIFFIVVLLGCNRLSYLVNYCEVNNEIDGYLFDNFNTLLYMYITNSTSDFYGEIIYSKKDIDYLNEGINDFYAAIQDKETIESEHANLFPALYDIINLDCSQGMMPDDYFTVAAKNIGVEYNEYFKGICKIFPVATTGNDNSMLLEVIYMIDQLYHRYEQTDFDAMFVQMHNSVLFDCYTLVLTLNRVIRNYFNNYIFIDEVNTQFDYFTTLIIFYLVFNMILELIMFMVLNFGIISQIKNNNKLMLDFIASLKF